MNGMIVTRPLSYSEGTVSIYILGTEASQTHIRRPVADFGDELARLDIDHGQIVRVSDQDELESIDRRTELVNNVSVLDGMGTRDVIDSRSPWR